MIRKIPIKFRGEDISTGEYIYGDVAHTALGILMGNGCEVKPSSVVQLIGYDKYGKEIYEGDRVCNPEFNHYFIARLATNLTGREKCITKFSDLSAKFRGIDFSGNLIYGYYFKDREGKTFIIKDNGERCTVKPESISQLVGYDSKGNEVYNGDSLINKKGETTIVELTTVFSNTKTTKHQRLFDTGDFCLK